MADSNNNKEGLLEFEKNVQGNQKPTDDSANKNRLADEQNRLKDEENQRR
ncbi:hypothetical protein SAMN04488137_1487 [Fictibacillus solisalsi]|uniref:Uncharacterized protein n=1 Tax=Fictibacillus solisalsi TaxID=459525 RepID=A0A1G9VCH5_9BACL|nr:hypothetical protein [Fictibacillus solisalsi]SDM69575.1 hypothetical protein SAMN04488137_1487 [Fictibacillus solisalsi]